MFEDKTVLITGGTGSFGMKMVRRLLDDGCQQIRVFSRDEAKQHQMRVDFGDERLQFHIGDVRSEASLHDAMHDVDLVFHAAALKQVPSCEFFPMEAVLTNVIGSANTLRVAQQSGVAAVVCLSTDKAVLPVNAMGMSKALMEKVTQAAARTGRSDTRMCSVRYGNVMYSRGSVIPLFVQQIFNGQPLTVTEPSMTRFLLPLEVAVELVAHAFVHGESGDVFIRKAPATTIGNLAEAMQILFEAPNPIEVIGVRHGEKLYETLATYDELRNAEDMGAYWRLRMDGRDLNYAEYFSEGSALEEATPTDYHSHNADQLDTAQTAALLAELPEISSALERWKAIR